MKRSLFLTILSVLNGLLGLFLMLNASAAAVKFGVEPIAQSLHLLKNLGTMLFSIGVLDFWVRNESDSNAMKGIFVFNFIGHGLGVIFILMSLADGTNELSKVGPGMIVPIFGTIGSLVYLLKIKIDTSIYSGL